MDFGHVRTQEMVPTPSLTASFELSDDESSQKNEDGRDKFIIQIEDEGEDQNDINIKVENKN